MKRIKKKAEKRERKSRTCLISLGDLLKFSLGISFVCAVLIRMPFHGQPPVRLLQVIVGSIPVHLQYDIIINTHLLFTRSDQNPPSNYHDRIQISLLLVRSKTKPVNERKFQTLTRSAQKRRRKEFQGSC